MEQRGFPMIDKGGDLENRGPGGKLPVAQGTGVRWVSQARLGELPLLSVAIGPDPLRGEMRGHARGVLAVGDLATGWLAVGGIARGAIAIGGVAVGLLSVGGVSLGGLAVGGLALGGIALGGAAIGVVAIGGLAVGYYALGGLALGPDSVRALGQGSVPEWLERYLPWLKR
jgi:hypothetical protein